MSNEENVDVVDQPLPPKTSDDAPGPSNANQQTPVKNNRTKEFDDLGILTQFIGKAAGESANNNINPTTSSINHLMDEFKEEYSNLVDTLDRAYSHLDALKAAKMRGRTPLKLRITIKPMVIKKDRTEFQTALERAIRNCKNLLLNKLIEHLKTNAMKTNNKIRATTKVTWTKIKAIDLDQVKSTLEEALKECKYERKTRADI